MGCQKNGPVKVIIKQPMIATQKKLVSEPSKLDTFLVNIVYIANKNDNEMGHKRFKLKLNDSGLIITITPINPIKTANHLIQPTFSFKNGPDKAITTNG